MFEQAFKNIDNILHKDASIYQQKITALDEPKKPLLYKAFSRQL
jgi:hypothetical protein